VGCWTSSKKLLAAKCGDEAVDVGPIRALLDESCDLKADILPTVRDLITYPLQPPLKFWGVPWLAEEIRKRRDVRLGTAREQQTELSAQRSGTPTQQNCFVDAVKRPAKMVDAAPRAQTSTPLNSPGEFPGRQSFDMSEVVAGYVSGTLAWDTKRFGPPPGQPGCRIDEQTLREGGFQG
jgi:hypothetical protein